MKKSILALSISALLAGCGSDTNDENTSADNNSNGDSSKTIIQERKWGDGFFISNPNIKAHSPTVKVLEDGTAFIAWIEEASENKSISIFSAVIDTSATEEEKNRDQILIHQVSAGLNNVIQNNDWIYSRDKEGFAPDYKLLVRDTGEAYLVWTEAVEDSVSLYSASYSFQSDAWSSPNLIVSGLDIKGLSLIEAQGEIVLTYKQSNGTGYNLNLASLDINSDSFVYRSTINSNIKPEGDYSIWSNDQYLSVAYVEAIDNENDKLSKSFIFLDHSVSEPVVLDSTGIKSNVSGLNVSQDDYLFFIEEDEFGYDSIYGYKNLNPLPQVENNPWDASHLFILSKNENIYLSWSNLKGVGINLGMRQYFNSYNVTNETFTPSIEMDGYSKSPKLISTGDELFNVDRGIVKKYSPEESDWTLQSSIMKVGSIYQVHIGDEHGDLDLNGFNGVTAFKQLNDGIYRIGVKLAKLVETEVEN